MTIRKWLIAALLFGAGITMVAALQLPDRHLPNWPPANVTRTSVCASAAGGKIDLSTGCIVPGVGP